ncbi:putative U4/U6.U5 tri-snRNP-associated protein 2 [Blattamonas nauphoetae]|uniref:U4/U6.U5 tri-snRNP-associated protein 2 n=1 Tax=Blattamonas nauphoetae TaxID=2049346 RepID=A0ABQ9YKR0_9EUKA|nr:putative U4/U6.U5 tri-snRNP-associated protein 2 [Blattamonas nauphoetae]
MDIHPKRGSDASDEPTRHGEKVMKPMCPFLDTINRSLLDFDFEQVCCMTLSPLNVYCCLVCGQYFRGRGDGTPAYTHSFETEHHLFMNLQTLKAYSLPDGNEVDDPSLNDIRDVIQPKFPPSYLQSLDTTITECHALDGTVFYPGYVGLNNIGENRYLNVIVHALSQVAPLRQYLISLTPPLKETAPLLRSFSMLVQRMWNKAAFKSHVSPHDFTQCVDVVSKKEFALGVPHDAKNFIVWLLNALKAENRVFDKSKIIDECFQGKILISTTSSILNTSTEKLTSFLLLSMDIPASPMVQENDMGTSEIPQMPLYDLLQKFDGEKKTPTGNEGQLSQYSIKKFPKYLIMHYNRFVKNQFFMEKNPTIINFPMKGLDMAEYGLSEEHVIYDLVASVAHEGSFKNGEYSVFVLHKPTQKWFVIQDMTIEETIAQRVVTSTANESLYYSSNKYNKYTQTPLRQPQPSSTEETLSPMIVESLTQRYRDLVRQIIVQHPSVENTPSHPEESLSDTFPMTIRSLNHFQSHPNETILPPLQDGNTLESSISRSGHTGSATDRGRKTRRRMDEKEDGLMKIKGYKPTDKLPHEQEKGRERQQRKRKRSTHSAKQTDKRTHRHSSPPHSPSNPSDQNDLPRQFAQAFSTMPTNQMKVAPGFVVSNPSSVQQQVDRQRKSSRRRRTEKRGRTERRDEEPHSVSVDRNHSPRSRDRGQEPHFPSTNTISSGSSPAPERNTNSNEEHRASSKLHHIHSEEETTENSLDDSLTDSDSRTESYTESSDSLVESCSDDDRPMPLPTPQSRKSQRSSQHPTREHSKDETTRSRSYAVSNQSDDLIDEGSEDSHDSFDALSSQHRSDLLSSSSPVPQSRTLSIPLEVSSSTQNTLLQQKSNSPEVSPSRNDIPEVSEQSASQVTTSNDKVEKELAKVEKELAKLRRKLTKATAQNEKLSQTIADLNERCVEQETHLDATQQQISETAMALSQQKEANILLEKQLASSRQEVIGWTKKDAEKTKTISDLSTSIKSLTAKIEDNSQNLADKDDMISQMKEAADQLNHQINTLTDERNELKKLLGREHLIDVECQTNWFCVPDNVVPVTALQPRTFRLQDVEISANTVDFDEKEEIEKLFSEQETKTIRVLTEEIDKASDVYDSRQRRKIEDPYQSVQTLRRMDSVKSKMTRTHSKITSKRKHESSLSLHPQSPTSRRLATESQLPSVDSDTDTVRTTRAKSREEERRMMEEQRRFNAQLSTQLAQIDTIRSVRHDGHDQTVFDWSWMDKDILRSRLKNKDCPVPDVELIVLSFPALAAYNQQMDEEADQLWTTCETIRTSFTDTVRTLCRAGRQATLHMTSMKELVDELDTINSTMTVDLSCGHCLKLMTDPVTFIPCGHTLCRLCAYKNGKQGKTQCPLCKDSDNLTRGFVTNYTVESLCTREAVKRQRMDEVYTSAGRLLVAQTLLEERMRKLPQARMMMDEVDASMANRTEVDQLDTSIT